MKTKIRQIHDSLFLAGILFITALIHLSSIKNHLVADSWVFVTPRSFLETLTFFGKSIIPPEWNALWLRPIPMLFFWVDSILWPGTEWGPHLTNIVFHLLNVYLIWLLMRYSLIKKTTSSTRIYTILPSFAACFIYGIHPLTVGGVDWVAARFDVMCVTFGLAGMLSWFTWDGSTRTFNSALGSVILFACSILSKEQGVVFPVVVFIISVVKTFSSAKIVKRYLHYAVLLASLMVVYLIYRLLIFHGMGGYMQTERGLSLIPPLAYGTVLLFPFLNIYSGWTLTLVFAGTIGLIMVMLVLLWFLPPSPPNAIKRIYWVSAAFVTLLGLLSTAPHAGMSFMSIVNFSESRFALIPLTGLSLLAGYAVFHLIHSPAAQRIVLVVLFIWGIFAVWRTSVQIQAWHAAGLVARHIVTTAVSIAPNPPQNSMMLFFDVPRSNQYYAYIFGIGLKEALMRHYPGRNDITIVPNASGKNLKTVNPERDYVFGFNKSKGRLERLYPQKKPTLMEKMSTQDQIK